MGIQNRPSLDRRAALTLLGLAGVAVGAGPARAGQEAPFDQGAFDAALKSGKPVLIHVATGWCPICKAQKPILEKLRAEDRFKDLTTFLVDFDTDRAAARGLDARHQSTIIVFKGGKEVGRMVGESQPEWIEDLLEKAL